MAKASSDSACFEFCKQQTLSMLDAAKAGLNRAPGSFSSWDAWLKESGMKHATKVLVLSDIRELGSFDIEDFGAGKSQRLYVYRHRYEEMVFTVSESRRQTLLVSGTVEMSAFKYDPYARN